MSSASSFATLEACLSASSLPLRHSKVLKPPSPSIFLSLRQNPHHIVNNGERQRQKQTQRERERTHLHFPSSLLVAIIVFLLDLSMQQILDLHLQYSTVLKSHSPPSTYSTLLKSHSHLFKFNSAFFDEILRKKENLKCPFFLFSGGESKLGKNTDATVNV